jgi:hypothetical protein
MSLNIRRQIAGDVARFLPPGHSSLVKNIGTILHAYLHAVVFGISDHWLPSL